ncbi:hypothetical protein AMELA_G00215300 [Ameiurus melas]|uniref:Uncharacterized protein n=1 Tax=Ameiurus melas TaxID=219545 RepID=A0A7J6A172_AMEME|nr:hypothetical protein AMELA_G00215300 [Ameiurus melas]
MVARRTASPDWSVPESHAQHYIKVETMRRRKKERVGGRDEVQHRHRLSSSSASPSLHRREGWECTEASQAKIVFPSDTDQDKRVPTGAYDETDSTIVKTVMFSCSHSA